MFYGPFYHSAHYKSAVCFNFLILEKYICLYSVEVEGHKLDVYIYELCCGEDIDVSLTVGG
jgi:hypothetical protein